jgi:hypothetical protein
MFASPVRLAGFPSLQSPIRSLLVAAWIACIAMSGSAHADSVLSVIGGAGGGGFSARCPGDERLIGISVRRGDDLDANGSRDPHVAARDSQHGGDGGRADNIVCAAKNPVVVGLWVTFEGGDRRYVNDVGLSCGSPAGRPAGSSPGGIAGMQYCPTGQVGAGLHGRSGAMVDALGLICAAAMAPPPPPPTPAPAPAPHTPVMPNDRRSATSEALRPATRVGTQITAVTTPVPRGVESTTVESSDASPAQSPPPPSRKTSSRDAILHAVSDALASMNGNAAGDTPVPNGPRTGERPIAGERIEGNRQDRYPPARPSAGRAFDTVKGHGGEQAVQQAAHSLLIDLRYPVAYGYKDTAGPGGTTPDSCSAFFISVRPASGVRVDAPPRIDTLGPMRRSIDNYVCTFVVAGLPFDAPLLARVVMSDQRAAGSAVWQGGSQAQPPGGQRRTIVDAERTFELTAARPKAAMRFEMVYSGSP